MIKIALFFAYGYKFLKIKNLSKKLCVDVVKNGYD